MRPKTGREAMRQILDIWASGLKSGAVTGAIVLPFTSLGLAWGAAIVVPMALVVLVALMARNYNQILLFAMRRGGADLGPRDAAALRQVFEEFAAERRTASTWPRRAVDTCSFGLSKWLTGPRRLGVPRRLPDTRSSC